MLIISSAPAPFRRNGRLNRPGKCHIFVHLSARLIAVNKCRLTVAEPRIYKVIWLRSITVSGALFFAVMTIFYQQGVLMKFFSKLISQILIASMVLLPFTANAGMIATDQVVASAAAQANRDKVLGFVARADVQKQMETLGLTPANAADRVNAMTDEEVQRVAGFRAAR